MSTTVPELSYEYAITVGGHSWGGIVGDPAEYGPVDGFTITRQLEDTELWPGSTAPVECRFQLIVASMDDVPDVKLGAIATAYVWRPAASGGSYTEWFVGRVADLTAVPHDLGMLLTLNCLDHSAELRETTVGADAWPSENAYRRVTRIMSQAGYGDLGDVVMVPWPPNSSLYPINVPTLAARDPNPTDAWAAVQDVLRQWPVDYGYLPDAGNYRGYARNQLVPATDGAGNVTRWELWPTFERPAYTGPLLLTDLGGWKVLTPVPAAGVKMLDAAVVDWSAQYAQTKDNGVSRVTVTGEKFSVGTATVVADLGVVPPVNAPVDGVELVDLGVAATLAGMYLPGEVPVSRWVADAFTWHVELSPAGTAAPGLGEVFTVSGLDPNRNPNDRAWFTGQVSKSVFTLADKRATYELELRRPDFDVPNTGVLAWGSTGLAGTTWANIHPTVTWDDLRLTRGA